MSTSHLQIIMTAQEYIQSRLDDLRTPLGLEKIADDELVAEAIFRALTSKKFRKYAAKPELLEHMKTAIRLNIDEGEPINLTFLHGAYKLWRLEETPEVDWAELFSLIYYSNWVKSVCEIYAPGVWFDFFVDDLIIPRLDNIDPDDIDSYLRSYQKLLDFLRPYQPKNLKMTFTTVGGRFESFQEFDESLTENIKKLTAEIPGGLPILSKADRAMVELNTKATDEQLQDPLWRERVFLIHNAYMLTKSEPAYHNQPTKIKVFPQPLPTGMVIAVGSTKDSIAKFWVAVGALKIKDDSYRQIILSPSQLKNSKYELQPVSIEGLNGKNFNKIRVLIYGRAGQLTID